MVFKANSNLCECKRFLFINHNTLFLSYQFYFISFELYKNHPNQNTLHYNRSWIIIFFSNWKDEMYFYRLTIVDHGNEKSGGFYHRKKHTDTLSGS